MAASLSYRQATVLIALCRQYVRDGRPVASAILCKEQGLDWSSATIRAELGSLERAGLVHKPHAASGRVPTPEGWRVFVDQLPRGAARPEHQRLLDVGISDGDPRRGLRATARVLSELAGCVAIGFVGEARPGVIRAVELLPLAGAGSGRARVLVMLALEDGGSSVRTVELDRAVLDDAGQLRRGQLERISGALRELTVGRSLDDSRVALRELLAAQQERVDRSVAEALRIG
ncbi:MAG: hypothetical protein KC431_30210, partial [Myxococcales bacterium]|nr:hypothetical protein [Myxococcales bacterium]